MGEGLLSSYTVQKKDFFHHIQYYSDCTVLLRLFQVKFIVYHLKLFIIYIYNTFPIISNLHFQFFSIYIYIYDLHLHLQFTFMFYHLHLRFAFTFMFYHLHELVNYTEKYFALAHNEIFVFWHSQVNFYWIKL